MVTWLLLFWLGGCIGSSTRNSQRYRVTLRKDPKIGLGLRLIKLKERVIILDIVSESPASRAAGGVLGIGDAIAAVNKVPVPPNSAVSFVQSMIINGGNVIELIIDKHWQHAARSGSSGRSAQTASRGSSSGSSQTTRKTWRYVIKLTRSAKQGFGLRLRKRADTPFIVIDGVIPNSPAAALNLIKPNDQIEAIDGGYLVDTSLDQVISYLREHTKVKLNLLSGSSTPAREFYVDLKIPATSTTFLGMELAFASHNNSVYIKRIFKSGIAAQDGRFALGDNLVAVAGLDVLSEVTKLGDGAVESVSNALKDGLRDKMRKFVTIRIKRVVLFDHSIQDELEQHASQAKKPQQRTRSSHEQNPNQKKRGRLPRYGEDYRVKIRKGPRGLGLKFTTKASGAAGRTRMAVVSSVGADMPAARLEIIRTGDVVVSFQGHSMRQRTNPIAVISQLAARSAVGTIVDVVFRRENNDGKTRRRKNGPRRFGRGAKASDERAQTLRPKSVSCEVISPKTLTRVFKHSNGHIPCVAAEFGPPISDEPGVIGRIVKSEPLNGCEPLEHAHDRRFKGSIVVMMRGSCYFNTKVINAQRAGAIGVVISQDPGNLELFSMGIDANAAAFQPEPVSIPAVMISHNHARILLNTSLENQVRFGFFGNYGDAHSVNNVDLAVPERDPFEMMLRFEQGSFDLRLGRPGIVGNVRARGGIKRIEHHVPFDALYHKTELVIPLRRTEICPVCHGKGGIEGGLKSCPVCGQTESPGRHVVHDHLGGSCSQQTERTCHVCHGHGEVLKTPKHICPHCHGQRTVSRNRQLNLTLPPGFPYKHTILFRSLGNESPYSEAGDVEVIIKYKTPTRFRRLGADLHATIHLDLFESLMGFTRRVQLPDNRTVSIVRRDKLCAPGTTFTFRGYGLPIFHSLKSGRQTNRNTRKTNYFIPQGQGSNHTHAGNSSGARADYGSLVVVAALRPKALEELSERQRLRVRNALKHAHQRPKGWTTQDSSFNDDLENDFTAAYSVKEANVTNLIRGINRFWFSSSAYKNDNTDT